MIWRQPDSEPLPFWRLVALVAAGFWIGGLGLSLLGLIVFLLWTKL